METMTSPNSIIDKNLGYVIPGKILLVEDITACALLVQEIFSEKPVQVVTVDSGLRAIEMLQQTKDVDVVLLDIRLPDIDGFEVYKRIRKINKEIPVIAVTAAPSQIFRLKCMKMGFANYILKPFAIEELIRSVNIVLLNKYKS